MASARIRLLPLPPEHRRTAEAASGTAASRSFVKVRNMAKVGGWVRGGAGEDDDDAEVEDGGDREDRRRKWEVGEAVPGFIRPEVVGD